MSHKHTYNIDSHTPTKPHAAAARDYKNYYMLQLYSKKTISSNKTQTEMAYKAILARNRSMLGKNTSLVAKGALAHHLHRMQNSKGLPGGPKMADGVWAF